MNCECQNRHDHRWGHAHPENHRSTACRAHIAPGQDPTNRQCRDPGASRLRAVAELLAQGEVVVRPEAALIAIAVLTGLIHGPVSVSYTHLRAHETVLDLVC